MEITVKKIKVTKSTINQLQLVTINNVLDDQVLWHGYFINIGKGIRSKIFLVQIGEEYKLCFNFNEYKNSYAYVDGRWGLKLDSEEKAKLFTETILAKTKGLNQIFY